MNQPSSKDKKMKRAATQMRNLSYEPLVLELESLDVSHSPLSVYLVVLFVYVFIVAANVSMVLVIWLNRSLHQPMCLLYLNLSINDVLGNTTVIPRLLVDILRPPPERLIHLYECVLQAFLSHLFNSTGHTILMIMAFDRYVAICEPLRYASIMTNRTLLKLTVFAWGAAFVLVGVLIGLTLRLNRCRSFIAGLYCANASLFKLSCENTYINNVYGLFFTVVLFSGSIGTMVLTYSKITIVCLTNKNRSLNRKALQTCSTHLVVYLLFLLSGLLIITFHRFPNLTQERKYLTIMFHVVPSSLNPIIYGIQSKEIRTVITSLLGKKVSAEF